MTFVDMNQSIVPPQGYEFQDAVVQGAFLCHYYTQSVYEAGTTRAIALNRIAIYQNDQGREVGRSLARIDLELPAPNVEPEPLPVAWRFRVWNGFLLALYGLQEMFTWPR